MKTQYQKLVEFVNENKFQRVPFWKYGCRWVKGVVCDSHIEFETGTNEAGETILCYPDNSVIHFANGADAEKYNSWVLKNESFLYCSEYEPTDYIFDEENEPVNLEELGITSHEFDSIYI
jgi:hypothetical protein